MKTCFPGDLEEVKEMNSANNLIEFRNTFFPNQVSRQEYSPIDT